ncbi:hypothetical protein BJY04DRAFT_222566 [Aspergillus karnatakaensis]|uniref:uncharacterized protein n=1 Tax=Aspergillus karnatakaensis TaxID=1810916 RepID=UPI003CCC9B3C
MIIAPYSALVRMRPAASLSRGLSWLAWSSRSSRVNLIAKKCLILDIAGVYATDTTALQLEAQNRPSKNLLLDINLREELKTTVDHISQQL